LAILFDSEVLVASSLVELLHILPVQRIAFGYIEMPGTTMTTPQVMVMASSYDGQVFRVRRGDYSEWRLLGSAM
jgi:hypothetical protein